MDAVELVRVKINPSLNWVQELTALGLRKIEGTHQQVCQLNPRMIQ